MKFVQRQKKAKFFPEIGSDRPKKFRRIKCQKTWKRKCKKAGSRMKLELPSFQDRRRQNDTIEGAYTARFVGRGDRDREIDLRE